MFRARLNWVAPLVAGLLSFTLVWSPGTARGDFVTQMTGLEDSTTVRSSLSGSSAPIGTTLTFSPGGDSVVGTINGSFPGAHVFADVTLGATVNSFSTGPLGTTYHVDPLAAPFGKMSLFFDPRAGLGGGTAVLELLADTFFVSKADPTKVQISGAVKLVSSTVVRYDFSGFADTGRFEGVGFSARVLDFNRFLVTGVPDLPRGAQGFSWTMTASPAPPGLVLASVGGVCLVSLAWLRRPRRQTAAA
jgi:hypothetical protein